MNEKPRIVASVEARMGSSRLPGKMLADIVGKPSIIRLLERLKQCAMLDDIVLATTVNPLDDPLVECVKEAGFNVYRGSEDDVLDRVVQAHSNIGSDIIVEITGDCPLLDPDVIDMGIYTYLNNKCDVVSNTVKLSFPQGVDVQVFAFDKLEWVSQNIKDEAVREHVSLYFYENEGKYNIIHMQAPPRWRAPDLRFQLDYPEDLEFTRAVYSNLEPKTPNGFGVEDVINLLHDNTNIANINAHCEEKAVR